MNNLQDQQDHQVDPIRDCFVKFDRKREDMMSTSLLEEALYDLGVKDLSDNLIFHAIADQDPTNTGKIQLTSFREILQTIR